MSIKVNDIVRGTDREAMYNITNIHMKKAIVTSITEDEVTVTVIEHDEPKYAYTSWTIDPSYLEVIGHVNFNFGCIYKVQYLEPYYKPHIAFFRDRIAFAENFSQSICKILNVDNTNNSKYMEFILSDNFVDIINEKSSRIKIVEVIKND